MKRGTIMLLIFGVQFDILFGAFLLSLLTAVFTIAFFYTNFKSIETSKKSAFYCILSLFIPIISISIFTIIPIRINSYSDIFCSAL